MRTPKYLSPSAIDMFYSNPSEYYLNYLADNRPPRIPQTQPMAVGSSFDAYAKSFLHERLFGKGHDVRFEFQTIFEAQVESQNRDFAIVAGQHCFDSYKASGALADLMLELQKSIVTPRFEFEVQGAVGGYREPRNMDVADLTLLGKPDVFFINCNGAHVILDWKVNGYCSKWGVSPSQGYVRLRKDGLNEGQHKKCQLYNIKGMMCNIACHLEDVDPKWAAQLSVYAWLCGEEVGADFITAIDQLVCKPGIMEPEIRVAEHRCTVSKNFQQKTLARAYQLWEIIHSDHFFRDLSQEDSKSRCVALEEVANAYKDDAPDNDKWFANVTRF